MGRPYRSELEELAATYEWAGGVDVGAVREAVERTLALPLLAVGSGGSLTTATFMAALHKRFAKQPAAVVTPFEMRESPEFTKDAAVWLFSAGGSNADVRGALAAAADAEVRELVIACAKEGSKLGAEGRALGWPTVVELENPNGKDGFLATNSLLSTCHWLARAVAHRPTALPRRLTELTDCGLGHAMSLEEIAQRCEILWQRSTLVVLHGGRGRCCAVDLESKFTEAGLGCVQMADYRNFAHGRHHWLAKHGETSAVLALVDDQCRSLASRTLHLIPGHIPRVTFELQGAPPIPELAGVLLSLMITGAAGEARGLDPGQPNIPDFGRCLHVLRYSDAESKSENGPREIAIARKSGFSSGELPPAAAALWNHGYQTALAGLRAEAFLGVAFDWDGTLVSVQARRQPPSAEVVAELCRLLDNGVLVGVATDRGDSVKRDLRAVLPKAMWSRVVVGYHNDGKVQPLDSDEGLPDDAGCDPRIQHAEAVLRASYPFLELRRSRVQLSVRAVPGWRIERLWSAVSEAVATNGNGLRVMRSSHSVDVVTQEVTKLDMVAEMRGRLGGSDAILRIGDRGAWPGKDYELLDHSYGLSSDEVSGKPAVCWNLAPRGMKSASATLYYLRSLECAPGGCGRFNRA